MIPTGKYLYVDTQGRTLRLFNQRCREWTQNYGYQGSDATLSGAGCGIFSVGNAVCFLNGLRVDADSLAVFSMENGGRGDDGTDRPALLSAMEEKGLAGRYGFSYRGDGLRNDLDALYDHLVRGGAALGNLRVGHIVALCQAREENGERQVLALDPYSETNHEKVTPYVREIIPESAVISAGKTESGLPVFYTLTYAMYWMPLSRVHDFNLLHPQENRV